MAPCVQDEPRWGLGHEVGFCFFLAPRWCARARFLQKEAPRQRSFLLQLHLASSRTQPRLRAARLERSVLQSGKRAFPCYQEHCHRLTPPRQPAALLPPQTFPNILMEKHTRVVFLLLLFFPPSLIALLLDPLKQAAAELPFFA